MKADASNVNRKLPRQSEQKNALMLGCLHMLLVVKQNVANVERLKRISRLDIVMPVIENVKMSIVFEQVKQSVIEQVNVDVVEKSHHIANIFVRNVLLHGKEIIFSKILRKRLFSNVQIQNLKMHLIHSLRFLPDKLQEMHYGVVFLKNLLVKYVEKKRQKLTMMITRSLSTLDGFAQLTMPSITLRLKN
jgi:hypothetical protein